MTMLAMASRIQQPSLVPSLHAVVATSSQCMAVCGIQSTSLIRATGGWGVSAVGCSSWEMRIGERNRETWPPCCAPQSAGAEFHPDPSAFRDDSAALEQAENPTKSSTSGWKIWQMTAGELRDKVAKLGRAGLLAYGLFNGITYTSFFVVAFLGFEKSTGQNPANNLKACLGVMVSMWTGNNFTRPLRVAGAAALAPFMDKVLKKTQAFLKLPDEASAFVALVILLIVLCAGTVGLLILSRLGR